jgi:uncharacterized protein (DUF885 family)
MKMRFIQGAAAVFAFLAAMLASRPTAQEQDIEAFFRDFSAIWVRGNPDLATATRYFTGPEQDALERQLTPQTDAWRQERVRLAREGLEQLRRFDRRSLTQTQRISADVMEWLLDTAVRSEAFAEYVFPFEQFRGVNVDVVNTLTVVHPLSTAKDADNYLARLALVDDRIDEAMARAEPLITRGLIPPRFILEATLEQLRQFVAPAASQNPFVTAYVDRMGTAIPEADRSKFRDRAVAIVDTEVYPAWRKVIALLEPLLARASDDAGLWRFERGAEAYANELRRFTTTSLTAEEIHQIGLREVARLEREMDGILRRLGRTEGTIKDRTEELRADLSYPTTEQGRTQIMADIDRLIRDAERRAATQFDRRPKAPVIAKPYPPFREASAAASYNPPSPDGSRPGTFQMPLRPRRMTRFALRTLVYHETVPGHHFQIALEMENEAVPRFRRIRALGGISASTEGWALYAERIAAESGWYENDLEGLLGQLHEELFRARRLVVDTGIHAKRWTRQQAIDYGIEKSEVERYVVLPGQACSYMLGQLKILELREKARTALADRFSIRAFHNAVLGAGTAPLAVVEAQVDEYIRGANGKSPEKED